MSHVPTLNSLGRQPTSSKRARPPNMTLADDVAIPLRPEQLPKRESRLGIRSLFGRKGQKDTESPDPKTIRTPSRSSGLRASLADMSNWHYGQQPVRPDVAKDPSTFISRPLSTTAQYPTIEEMQARAHTQPRNGKHLAKQHPRAGLVQWDAPPLFKAYPQAIKHSTLPASILSPEALLRARAKGLADVTGDQSSSFIEPDTPIETDAERIKMKRGWSAASPEIMSEWTAKIYILVTSGCLLQYSSEGPFDRLPEKVLQLGKASAAFASDAIPGRHWVLQVSSALDSDGTTASDQRSLFSRLPFRVAERRQASNFLMVFECAEEMDSWLATLRQVIEYLGGKKSLSETGKPKSDEPVTILREQASQRTLVVRDPDRYSKTFSVETSWRDESEAGDYETSTETGTWDQSLSRTSATNSVVSQDGHRLDSLRDTSPRLSAISSGQRTVLTSEGSSSPSCSPTRDSFRSSEEDKLSNDLSNCGQSRIRPNASAIVNRRLSSQTFGSIVDGRGSPQRSSSTMASPAIPETAVSPVKTAMAMTPNFSVPHSSSRRFSYKRTPSDHATALDPPPQTATRDFHQQFVRSSSMIVSQPHPHADDSERSEMRHDEGLGIQYFDPEAIPVTPGGRPLVAKRSSLLPREGSDTFGPKPRPRRLASTGALRHHEESGSPNRRDSRGQRLSIFPHTRPLPASALYYRAGSPTPPSHQVPKRTSLSSAALDRNSRMERWGEIPLPPPAECLPEPSPPPNMPLPPLPPTSPSGKNLLSSSPSGKNLLQTSPSSKSLQAPRGFSLLSRRSLPNLLKGPPPAPPPSHALPPIPRRPSVNT